LLRADASWQAFRSDTAEAFEDGDSFEGGEVVKSIRMLSAIAMVAILSGCGNSARSVSPDAVVDTTPPPAVTGISVLVEALSNDATLLWEPSAAADVSSYEIYTASGNSYGLIGSTSATRYGVPSVPSTFAVRAVDYSGNRSPYAIFDGTDTPEL
jgi:hypothetical protein